MIRDLEIDVLRAFVTIADTGGITSAARRLNRTQSAISMRMRRLEDTLGRKVLCRNGNGIKLTQDGEALLRHARRMLELNEAAVSELAQPEMQGVVRLAFPDGYGASFLPGLLSEFARMHPRVQLEIDCAMTSDIEAALDEGRLDFGLLVESEEHPRNEPLWSEPIVWAGSEKVADYADITLPLAVFQPGCVLRAQAIKALDSVGRSWRIAYCSTSLAAVQAAVVAGLGIGVIGESTIMPGMRVLRQDEAFPPLTPSNIVLRRASAGLSAVARELADYIACVLGSSSDRKSAGNSV